MSLEQRGRWRRWLAVAAVVLAVAELIDAFFIAVPIVGIVYGLAVGALAWWSIRSRAWVPVLLLLVLATLELGSVLFVYPNSESPPPLWRLAIFAVLTATVVVLALLSLFALRRSNRSAH